MVNTLQKYHEEILEAMVRKRLTKPSSLKTPFELILIFWKLQ